MDGRKKPKRVDLTGQKFNRLTAIRFLRLSEQRDSIWLWRCDCGNYRETRASQIKTGRVKSCGCLTIDVMKSRTKPGKESAINQLYRIYANGAKVRNLEFSISKEELVEITSKVCFYCGTLPMQTVSRGTRYPLTENYLHNGIDRWDNTKGYTMDNCVPCCEACNRAKHSKSQESFLMWMKSAYNYTYKSHIQPFTITVVKS
jgi:hypothetical protein